MIYKIRYSLLKKTAYVFSSEPLIVGRACIAEIDGEKIYAKVIEEIPEGKISTSQLHSNHVIRQADVADEIHYDLQSRRCLHFVSEANKLAEAKQLSSKFLAAEPLFDLRRIVFYFKVTKFENFRVIVKELRDLTQTQIDLRQVEGREVAKLISDIGVCGLQTCCTRFLFDTPIIKEEDVKEMWSNSTQSLGMCGRIKCCATFEKKESGTKSSCGSCSSGGCGDKGCGTCNTPRPSV